MKILIVEDHPLIRSGLKHLLLEATPDATVTQATTFPLGLTMLDKEKFDLLILDIDIPGGENIRMMEIVRQKQPDIMILINSGYDEQVYALPYMQAGADGFLSKQATEDEFYAAYRSLLSKGKYVSHRVQQTLLTSLGSNGIKKTKNPLTTLSQREMAVMQLLTEGKWTKEIASILNVKENTISTYKRRIYDKLEVSDEIELSKKVSLLRNY
ncbi:response regulator [Dyadobacter diqingensis]|uniref:response regulator n=1 Tax=Dyadobacter diqingensis TaxID=2938121 RepID=UPI0020C1AAA6|nr:response regulator transcription factor [Dyadobacter diqingensis]